MICTLEQAYEFVLREKVCTIFGSRNSPYPSLWDNVNLPDKRTGESGWGEKTTAIWRWKNELPATFPNEIFYGKVAGGDAVLMELGHLREKHYPLAKKEASSISPLAEQIYRHIKIEPLFTGELRKRVMNESACTRSRFDTALKKLQITLNIARSDHPDDKRDRWVAFSEMYPEIVEIYSADNSE